MPTRMIRESLLESDRFLNLPDNTARICYIALLLTADDRGNLEASSGRLVRLWRDFGVDSNQKAASIQQFLADQDLIRLYEADEKHFVHVPRFGQRLRNFRRSCPPSPWCKTPEETSNSPEKRQQVAATRSKTPPEEKRREEKRITTLSSSKDELDVARRLLAFLNEKAGRAYKAVPSHLSLIRARVREHGEESLRAMVAMKCREWRSDEKMAEYLRPGTLFNATKCADYVGRVGTFVEAK